MSCGCYIFERRNGEFFDSTKAIWSDGLFSDSWIPPTLGDFICLWGFAAFNVGGFLTFPAGLAVKGVEMCVVAPAYDVLWIPYDCYKYIERAPKRRIREGKENPVDAPVD